MANLCLSGRGGDASTGVEPRKARIYPTHHKTNQHLIIGLKFGISSNIAKENADIDQPAKSFLTIVNIHMNDKKN